MRSGWGPRLRELLHRADPALALIVEVVAVESSAIKDTREEWAAADATTGLEILPSSGARLEGDEGSIAEHTTDDGAEVDALSHIPPYSALVIEWSDDDAPEIELRNLTARLDPRADGGQPKEVAEWRAQLFTVANRGPEEDIVELVPISTESRVVASGEVASNVVFDFVGSWDGEGPKVGQGPEYARDYGPARFARPITVVRIWALTEDGQPAGNVAWLADSAEGSSKTGSGYTVYHRTISPYADEFEAHESGARVILGGLVEMMPRFALGQATYEPATITFSGSGNRITALGTTGDHEIVFDGQLPGDSTILAEIQASGGGTWYECSDGDLVGEDNTATGGSDLSALTKAAAYNMRATLTPSSSGFLTPVVRRLGVREITKQDLVGVTVVEGGGVQVDPRTLKANIAKATITVLKTGERDFRDYGTEILSRYHIGDIELRVWMGDPTGVYLSRREWLHLHSYEIEDYVSTDQAVVITGLSPLRRLRRQIPRFVVTSGDDGEREPVAIENVSLAAAAAEIIESEVGLPGRFVGPGIQGTDLVSKTIRDADAKDELDRLAYLDGSAYIESQGRIKAVKMMRDPAGETPVAFFLPGDFSSPEGLGPGFATRVDEFFVPYGWSESEGSFEGEVAKFNATAFTKLGGHGLRTTDREDEETAKWIPDDTLATVVAARVPDHFGNGLILWPIDPTYAQPHLEPGDPVVVVTDDFVGRSPISDQRVRGRVSALGIVAGVADLWGRGLDIWVPGFDQIVLGDRDVLRLGYRRPKIIAAEIVFLPDGSVRLEGQTEGAEAIRAVADDAAFQGTSTVDAQDLETVDSDGFFDVELAPAGSYAIGDTAYVSAHAYEIDDGTGSRSTPLTKLKRKRTEADEIDCVPSLDEDDGDWYLYPNRSAAAGAVYYTSTTDGSEPATPLGADEMGGPVGTLSTASEIGPIHTSTVDGQVVRVKMKPTADADGGGAVGPVRIARGTFHAANNLPEVTHHPFQPSDPANEGVRFVARDDGSTVDFGYAVVTDGDPAPSWPGDFTTTGQDPDPVVVEVEVARPAEGAADELIYFQAVDADGNLAFTKPRIIRVDGNAVPTGSFDAPTPDAGTIPRVIPNSVDSDTGSWRFRVLHTTEGDDTFPSLPATGPFNDSDDDEFSGSTFGAPVDLDATHRVQEGEVVNLIGRFFRTATATAAAQAASTASEPVYLQIRPSGAAQPIGIVVTSSGWEIIGVSETFPAGQWSVYRMMLSPGTAVESIHVRYRSVLSGGPWPWLEYDHDITDPELHTLRNDGDPTQPANLSVDSSLEIEITPYDDVDGEAGTGVPGPVVTILTGVAKDSLTGTVVLDIDDTEYTTDVLMLASRSLSVGVDADTGRAKIGAGTDAGVFGVDLTGATDSSAEMQDAIDWAFAQGGSEVAVRGIVQAANLDMKKGVELVGDGWGSVIVAPANAHTVSDSGTSSGSNTVTTINDTSKSWTTNEHRMKTCRITSGPLSGDRRVIVSNTATQLVIGMESGVGSEDWASTPGTVTYQILEGHPIVRSGAATDGQWGIRNIRLDGNKANQLAFCPGILTEADPGSVEFVDSMQWVRDVLVVDVSGWGFLKGVGCREVAVNHLVVQRAGRHGVMTWPSGGTDCTHDNVVVAGSGLSGIVANGVNDRYEMCKVFGSGQEEITNQGHGWLVTASTQHITGAESQENWEHGYSLNNADATILKGRASSNQQNGVHLFSTKYAKIDLLAIGDEGLLYTQKWAVGQTGAPGDPSESNLLEVTVDNTHSDGAVQPELEGYDNDIRVNARVKGRWFSQWGELADDAKEHFVFGKVLSPDAGNPYFALKTDASGVPVASIESFDGTITRSFLQLIHGDPAGDHGAAHEPRIVLGSDGSVEELLVYAAVMMGELNDPIGDGLEVGEIAFAADKWLRWEREYDSTLRRVLGLEDNVIWIGPDGENVYTGGAIYGGDVISVLRDTGEAFRFGKVGAPASGNPYYVLKHDAAGSNAKGLLQSWNGSTGSTFLVLDHANAELELPTSKVHINPTTLRFFGGTGSGQPTITGSRGGNAALASLLGAGAAMGLWVDSTTA